MLKLTIILLLVLSAILLWFYISWIVHLKMINECCLLRKKGTLKEFWEKFKEYDLKECNTFKGSYFAYKTDEYFQKYTRSCYHASIIEFDDVGMRLNFFDWTILNIQMYFYKEKSKTKGD